jgi:hypothetical protein
VKDADLKIEKPVIQLGRDNYINVGDIKKYSVIGTRKDMKISALLVIFFYFAFSYGQNNEKNKRNLSVVRRISRILHLWLIAIEEDDEFLKMLNISIKSNLRVFHTE